MNLESIQHFIREHLGLNAGTYGNDLWRELLVKRIDTVGARSPEDYLARLREDETELHTLTSLITINETYFYRESQHLRLLTERICPERLARRDADAPVRLLSVGCSTGEEPYSILIALRERYGELADHFFEVKAADVDRVALERARAGVYGRFSFRALSPQLQERYFSPVDANHFRIDESLRRQVSFQPLNLLAADYPETLAGQDVIFFRNVSIYFDEPTRRRVLERLKALLAPDGYLIVGISETLANDFGILALRERDGVFLFVNEPPGTEMPSVTRPLFEAEPKQIRPVGHFAPSLQPPLSDGGLTASNQRSGKPPMPAAPKQPTSAPARLSAPLVPHADSRSPATPPVTRAKPPDPEALDDSAADAIHDEALALAQSERHQAALERLQPLCAGAQPRPKDLVLKAHLLFEQGRPTDAIVLAHQVLENDHWSLEALLLLGRGARNQGQTTDAIAFLRRAIYHQPEAWPAHFQLAEVYRETRQAELARREYGIVLRQLDRDTQAVDPRAILIGAPALAFGDLRRLCRLRLTRLEAST
ncbi:MAG: tetratricopeptide repeat protein [Chromatiales bacterium]|nr:tetratricopeptide repeat protein [Chromatiales bacterium]